MEHLKSFRISKLLLQESGTYNDQMRRRYDTVLQNNTMNMMAERLAGVSEYQAPLFAGIANQFIAPQATPEKQIDISNGWSERRMRFMMEIEIDLYMGGRIKEVILGWTSHLGISTAGQIDPQMEFFVNSTLQIRETIANTPVGRQTYSSVVDNSHILVDPSWSSIYTAQADTRLRPEDVFTTMSRTHLSGLGKVADGRTMSMNTAVKSRRSNGSAANYMADILRSHKQASVLEEAGAGEQEILMKARGFAQENIAAADYFLAAISQLRGMGVSNVFQYSDLISLDEGVTHNTVASFLGQTQKSSVHQQGQTQHWAGADAETVAATVLSQSVPAAMMEVGLTNVMFKSTNQDIGSQMHTVFMDIRGFVHGDLSTQAQYLRNQLEQTILRDLTYNNSISYSVEMSVDLLGETWIKISLNGGPFIDYVTPSFCDALTVPVLTNNSNAATQLASDFELLASALSEASKDAHPTIQSAGGTAWGNI